MKARLSSILTVVSLLLAAGVLLPVIHSHVAGMWKCWRISYTSYPNPDVCTVRTFGVQWSGKQVGLGANCTRFDQSSTNAARYSPMAGLYWSYDGFGVSPSTPMVERNWLGFGSQDVITSTPVGNGRGEEWDVAAPVWFVLGVCLVLPGRWSLRYWRWRRVAYRVRKGLCVQCGYDLRASKERCPECGTAIAAESATGCEPKAV